MGDKIKEEKIKEFLNESSLTRLKLNDKVNVGCDNCGKCCYKIQTSLNAFDIYNISQVYDLKEILPKLDISFGENSGLPIVGLQTDNLCTFSDEVDGDFKCSLGEYKPKACMSPFLSIMTDTSELSFVPLDQEVTPLDPYELIDKHSINNSEIVFLNDRFKSVCKCGNKKEITVKEYLGDRYKYDKEYTISAIIQILLCRYINPNEFFKIIYLSDNSILSKDSSFPKDKSMYAIISSKISQQTLFYAIEDTPIDRKDFLKTSIKQFNFLQNNLYPVMRKLYQMLIDVFYVDEKEMREIINMPDEISQQAFDLYFYKNRKEISKRFQEEALKFMKDTANKNLKGVL